MISRHPCLESILLLFPILVHTMSGLGFPLATHGTVKLSPSMTLKKYSVGFRFHKLHHFSFPNLICFIWSEGEPRFLRVLRFLDPECGDALGEFGLADDVVGSDTP